MPFLPPNQQCQSTEGKFFVAKKLLEFGCSEWVDVVKVDVESLRQQLKEREDRENKLKQLALKAKKESAELRNKVCYLVLTQ